MFREVRLKAILRRQAARNSTLRPFALRDLAHYWSGANGHDAYCGWRGCATRSFGIGAHIEVEVNGKVVVKWDDPERPNGAGRIGLRSMEGVTMVAYDNIKVWQVSAKRNR